MTLAKNMAVITAHQLQAGFWLVNCLLRCRQLSVTVKRCHYASTQPDYATFSVLNGAGFTLLHHDYSLHPSNSVIALSTVVGSKNSDRLWDRLWVNIQSAQTCNYPALSFLRFAK
ncbi:hypothetical protein [Candidatus Nitrotoga sp. 1052]|uniref:hypothetical protein n=1 Tax=Candidatus Nitrotoga sp. 1052 TaxID=2886964 RepID=UPI001EF69581|nr:hypothetical protein [Candidatus Nitrotoga sp. 1052]